MSAADNVLLDSVTRIFRDLADPRAAGADGDDWRATLWPALEDSGVSRAWVPESAGGAGADMADGFAVLRRAGAFALAAPLAETLIAGWLLARAGLAVPPGPLAVAAAGADDGAALDSGARLRGAAPAVAFAAAADRFAALAGDGRVALVARAECRVAEGANLAGEPRNDVTFDGARPEAIGPRRVAARDLRAVGAVARAAQMAGALEAILDLTVEHARGRAAFGRPIAKFQAVQHELAKLAGEAAAADAAAGAAADAISAHGGAPARFDDRIWMEAACAKIRVGEAAGAGAAIAHQIHGAIGFTEEYVLHRHTRRLWSWRDDFGSESVWAAGLGRMAAAAGADEFWPVLTRPWAAEAAAP